MEKFFLILYMVSQTALGLTFQEAITKINSHEQVQALTKQSQAMRHEAKNMASWGDPMMKVAAKNYPIDSFKDDQTPMTGIEISVAQKLPLSKKFAHMEDASAQAAQAKHWESIHAQNTLYRQLWTHAISLRKLNEQKFITEENLQWIKKIIDVSKNLYANGKVSQQAILDLQIRKSELRSSLVEIEYGIEAELNGFQYLVGEATSSLDLNTVPWSILKLERPKEDAQDTKELNLAAISEAKAAQLKAKSSAFVPDLTLGVGYTNRANIDGHGDFIAISAQIPIPISDRRGAEYEQAALEQQAAELRLLDYRKMRDTTLASLQIADKRLASEIYILQSESISFAKNARKITAKAYQLGTADYVALLQSELKLQNLLLKNTKLVAAKSLNTLKYKFMIGEKLHD